jgi:hypothetical protein
MPVQPCQSDGKPGYKWGESGACYAYTPGDEASASRARASAERQGRAARAGGYEGMNKQEDWLGKPLYDELPEDERAFADALLDIAERFGPLDREDSNIWVGYEPAESNKDASIGVKCENCALVASQNKCAIISQEIELGGICRLSVIPPGYVDYEEPVELGWKGSFLPVV